MILANFSENEMKSICVGVCGACGVCVVVCGGVWCVCGVCGVCGGVCGAGACVLWCVRVRVGVGA